MHLVSILQSLNVRLRLRLCFVVCLLVSRVLLCALFDCRNDAMHGTSKPLWTAPLTKRVVIIARASALRQNVLIVYNLKYLKAASFMRFTVCRRPWAKLKLISHKFVFTDL